MALGLWDGSVGGGYRTKLIKCMAVIREILDDMNLSLLGIKIKDCIRDLRVYINTRGDYF